MKTDFVVSHCFLQMALLVSSALGADMTSTWDNTTNNWSDRAHWSSPEFPNNGNGGLTYDAVVNGGTVTLDVDVTFEAFTLGGGTLLGLHDLTANALTTFTGGTMAGAGTTFAAGGLELGGFGLKILDGGRILKNQAAATWTAGGIRLNGNTSPGSGILVNTVTGVIDNTFDGSINTTSFGAADSGADARFDNAGTFRKSAGTGTTSIGVPFNNTGTVEVLSGTIDLNQGGMHTGDFTIAPGATLQFGGGTHAIDGASFASPGRVLILSGTVDVTGGFAIPALTEITTGTLTYTADSIAGTYTQSGGEVRGDADLTVSGMTSFTGGTMAGAGTTFAAGGLELGGFALKVLDAGRILVNPGAAAWTTGGIRLNGHTAPGSGVLVNTATGLIDNTFDGSINTPSFGAADSGADARFDNAGTFRKSAGTGTTSIGVRFDNSGTVEVLSGTLDLTGGSTHTGDFTIAEGATLQFGGGTHTIDGASFASPGRVLILSGTVDVTGGFAIPALTEITTGTLTYAADSNAGAYTQSGGELRGDADLTVSGMTRFTGGTMAGAGTTFAVGGLELGGFGLKILDGGRTLENQAAATWTTGGIRLNGNTQPASGMLVNTATGVIDNTFDGSINTTSFGAADSGADARFDNSGTFRKSAGTGTTSIGVPFDNTGTVEVHSGTLEFTSGIGQIAGTSLAGGTWKVFENASLQLRPAAAAAAATSAADVTLAGPNSRLSTGSQLTPIENSLSTIASGGALRILGGRNYTTPLAFENQGTLQLGGGSFDAASLANTASGEIVGFGTIEDAIANAGIVRAASGALTVRGPFTGPGGTIRIEPGATLDLSAAGGQSSTSFLIHDGDALHLGANDVLVAADYANANFGEGNSFSARANVTGGGRILASGAVTQTLGGDVASGSEAAAVMDFGELHVGEHRTLAYTVQSGGGTGPRLRTAIQTDNMAAGGGNLTDPRLSGAGAVPQVLAPIEPGQSTLPLGVTFTAAAAGDLAGQQVAIFNNFDNVPDQILQFTGAAYNLAAAVVNNSQPIDFGIVHVGDTVGPVSLSITNGVQTGAFSEKLNAAIGTVDDGLVAGGSSLVGLAAGATDAATLRLRPAS
jgi:autotransporter-associated beta strand protein